MKDFDIDKGYRAVGVFDGHGPNGHLIAKFVADNAVKIIKQSLQTLNDSLGKSFTLIACIEPD